jgi:kumamolisin
MDQSRRLTRAVVLTTAGAVVGLSVVGIASAAASSPNNLARPMTALAKSYLGAPAHATALGRHQQSKMSVEVALQPRNVAALNRLMTHLYSPSSSQYHHWLGKGGFANRFAPTAATVTSVEKYLRGQGLSVAKTSSPFRVRAVGSAAQLQRAFATTLTNYRAKNGTRFFANSSDIKVPTSLAGAIDGVVGLSNTVRLKSAYITSHQAAQRSGKAVPKYGASPGGNGLTPSQLAHLYNFSPIAKTGKAGKGKGATLAVFELSGYTRSDIKTFTDQFFGPSYKPRLTDVNVDGGPVTPQCPQGDTCPYGPPDYSGDIEVEADIETQLGQAPDINGVMVYNAPNDETGQTELDEYQQIANDDIADSISSSWGECELDAGVGYAQSENTVFEQMAAQGQSVFNAAGDTGAYDCLRDTGSPNLTDRSVGDPAAQPWVTGVGGTSFGTYDPKNTTSPTYPKGFETVWNPLNSCSGSTSGQQNCLNYGAGGGGTSAFWPAPTYQHGPGVVRARSAYGPDCSLANSGQLCREVPDVSANADEYTPYAEYCTGDPSTNSTCAYYQQYENPPGWIGIGGTSLATPLWSAAIADAVSYHHTRYGNINPLMYRLLRGNKYKTVVHDITGVHQGINNNGLYGVARHYDMATGVGTPNVSPFIKNTK